MTITMYGADWCGDCRRAKAWFADNDVAYTYVNLEETPDAADIVLERNNGLKRIPVIVFDDDTHLTEPSNEALATKMSKLAGSTAEAEPVFAVVEKADASRFELQRDGETVSYATFNQNDGVVTIPHVATNPAHRGQGYAARLLDGTLEQLRASQRTVVPLCPFAAQHIRDTPAHHDLLASN